MSLVTLLGQPQGSDEVSRFVTSLSSDEAGDVELAVKEYPPVTYASSQEHGISLQFEQGRCQAIDLYNEGAAKGWKCFPKLPWTLTTSVSDKEQMLVIEAHTTGTDFVSILGEPSRKGGGEPLQGGGASGLGPGAWMEWQKLTLAPPSTVKVDLMVELKGPDARGAQRWDKEKGGKAAWGVITLSLAS